MKTQTMLMLGGLGVVLLGTTALQARNATPREQPLAPAVRAREVAAEGRVATYPGSEVNVSAERGGRLLAVRVQEGEHVHRGDVLAELDAVELRAQLAESRAKARQADAELRLAESTLARRRQLVAEQIVAAQDLDEAQRDVETAQARVATVLAEVDRYQAQLDKSVVRAPLAGTVTRRSVDAGETIEAGTVVATVADLSRLRVEGEADEADAAALAVGGEARITADAYPGHSWRGRIEEVADSVSTRRLKPQDPSRPTDTRILAVKVAFAETTPLKLGTTVELRIKPASR